MKILGIDTSAVSCGVAVLNDGKIISECYVNTGLTHSQTLLTLIDSCLKNCNLEITDIDYLAVSVGPGSFTGIRIGVSAVKGLCFSRNIPCFAVSTLEALAGSVFADDAVICPVMDARCMQVYTALFELKNNELVRLTEDAPLTLAELYENLKECNRKIVLVGDGSDIAFKYLSDKGLDIRVFSEIYKYQHGSGVAITAYRNYNNGISPVDAEILQPNYLRLSQAERELKNRSEKNDSIKQ